MSEIKHWRSNPIVKVRNPALAGPFFKELAVVSRVLCKIIKGQFFKEWQVVTHFSYGV